ncbi:hypothetical protein AGABI1DRAFT_93465 [Agaricus bisporus var. burnettii JB137-S8]|uniref:Transmembrane protein n=1 Tax=Agaricus bisporus var. burnettii (strain JB137-S8 / ATCC MYA-4627 / FGSC 10392) TaxID=597362 RepID=K5WPW7_AGABU|nr:uncharacterized protein AGABI1DRAFT_93465 [Agaricus bisporus var. burnettii JB137-S8]EKM77396.1 hypothetical protein AGABI1DRAFT_93465 [Agaricus bisporus var. burnettii JB137-S8]
MSTGRFSLDAAQLAGIICEAVFYGIYLVTCWIVYERRWLVIAPSLILYFCAIAMMIKVVEIESNPRVVESITNAIHPWFATMFGVSVVQNISTTGLLVWRIWRIENEVDKYINDPSGSVFNACRPRRLQKVMRVIAESGMIYTTTVFVAFLASVSGSNATCVVATMASVSIHISKQHKVDYVTIKALQAAGIAFNVILVRSIENNSELRVGVAGPGRITPIFQHTTGSASVDPEPNQNPRIEMMTAAP